MKIENKIELMNEIDLLRGNINRICVTDNFEELNTQFIFAIEKLMSIRDYNYSRLLNNTILIDKDKRHDK